jgi:hypothetical protein
MSTATQIDGILHPGKLIACFIGAVVLLLTAFAFIIVGMAGFEMIAKDPTGEIGGAFWLRFLAGIPVFLGAIGLAILCAKCSGHCLALLTRHELACKKEMRLKAEAEETRKRQETWGGIGTVFCILVILCGMGTSRPALAADQLDHLSIIQYEVENAANPGSLETATKLSNVLLALDELPFCDETDEPDLCFPPLLYGLGDTIPEGKKAGDHLPTQPKSFMRVYDTIIFLPQLAATRDHTISFPNGDHLLTVVSLKHKE